MGERADLTRVDVRLAVTKKPFEDKPWFMKCPETQNHTDSTHSLAVYPDHIQCYGCGFSVMRRMDALAYLLGVSVYQAIKRAPEFYVREQINSTLEVKKLSPAIARSYQSLLWTGRRDRLAWLTARGFTEQTIKQAMIGHDTTRFTIPVFNQAGELVTVRYRRDDLYGVEWWDVRNHQLRTLPKYSGVARHNECALYPLLDLSLRHVLLTEGELDALRLRQEGYHAITVTNGAGSQLRALDLLPASIDTIYIVMDQDAVGRLASRDVFIEASKRGLAVALAEWDLSWGKDVTDLYLQGHTVDDVKWTVNGEMARRADRHPATTEFGLTA